MAPYGAFTGKFYYSAIPMQMVEPMKHSRHKLIYYSNELTVSMVVSDEAYKNTYTMEWAWKRLYHEWKHEWNQQYSKGSILKTTIKKIGIIRSRSFEEFPIMLLCAYLYSEKRRFIYV